jgi:hypothetical protein
MLESAGRGRFDGLTSGETGEDAARRTNFSETIVRKQEGDDEIGEAGEDARVFVGIAFGFARHRL